MGWETLAWPMAGIALWVAAFFRDPIRVTPNGEGIITSPADGLVTMISEVTPPHELTSGDGGLAIDPIVRVSIRSAEHTSELQSLMRNSYAVFCLKKKN